MSKTVTKKSDEKVTKKVSEKKNLRFGRWSTTRLFWFLLFGPWRPFRAHLKQIGLKKSEQKKSEWAETVSLQSDQKKSAKKKKKKKKIELTLNGQHKSEHKSEQIQWAKKRAKKWAQKWAPGMAKTRRCFVEVSERISLRRSRFEHGMPVLGSIKKHESGKKTRVSETEWVWECVSEWVSWVSEWVSEWVSKQWATRTSQGVSRKRSSFFFHAKQWTTKQEKSERNEWVTKQASEWVSEWVSEWATLICAHQSAQWTCFSYHLSQCPYNSEIARNVVHMFFTQIRHVYSHNHDEVFLWVSEWVSEWDRVRKWMREWVRQSEEVSKRDKVRKRTSKNSERKKKMRKKVNFWISRALPCEDFWRCGFRDKRSVNRRPKQVSKSKKWAKEWEKKSEQKSEQKSDPISTLLAGLRFAALSDFDKRRFFSFLPFSPFLSAFSAFSTWPRKVSKKKKWAKTKKKKMSKNKKKKRKETSFCRFSVFSAFSVFLSPFSVFSSWKREKKWARKVSEESEPIKWAKKVSHLFSLFFRLFRENWYDFVENVFFRFFCQFQGPFCKKSEQKQKSEKKKSERQKKNMNSFASFFAFSFFSFFPRTSPL